MRTIVMDEVTIIGNGPKEIPKPDPNDPRVGSPSGAPQGGKRPESQARNLLTRLKIGKPTFLSTGGNPIASVLQGYLYGMTVDKKWCGSNESSFPEWSIPEVSSFSCMNHDNCYSSLDAVKSACDAQFLRDALNENPGLIFEAFVFYGAVALAGQSSFEKAQGRKSKPGSALSAYLWFHRGISEIYDAP